MIDRRIKFVPQHDSADCGAAILSSVTYFFGGSVDIYDCRKILQIDQGGSTFSDMCVALSSLKIGYEIYQLDHNEEISDIKQPFLIGLADHNEAVSGLGHYNFVYSQKNGFSHLIDPSAGLLRVNTKELARDILPYVIILTNGDVKLKSESKIHFSSLVKYIKSQKILITTILFFNIISIFLAMAPSVISGKFIDMLISNSFDDFNGLIISLVAVQILRSLISIAHHVFYSTASEKLEFKINYSILRKAFSLSVKTFSTRSIGDYLERFNASSQVRTFIGIYMPNGIVNFFTIVIYMIIMAKYSWYFFIAALFLALVILISVTLTSKWYKTKAFQSSRMFTVQFNLTNNILKYFKELSYIGNVKLFLDAWIKKTKDLKRFSIKMHIILNSINSLNALVINLAYIAVIIIGYKLIINKQLTVGELVTVMSLFSSFVGPLTNIFDSFEQYQNVSIADSKIIDIYAENSPTYGKEKCNILSEITCENLTLGYKDDILFENFSYTFMKHKVVGIKGESGSGKTTLLNSLVGAHVPTAGSIFFNRNDLLFYSKDQIITKIGYVSQYPQLFMGSLLFNITMKNRIEDVDFNHFNEVCKMLALNTMFDSFREGFYKFINDTGDGLSGGQKQRIAIARSMYRKVDFLVLDEPTSSLDIKSESIIVDAIFSQPLGIIFSTHKSNLFKFANEVLEINCDQKKIQVIS